ncbi:MAG: MFS transporter [Candidatus Sericytochromatia bacterium]|nr:MFS transporter [Candidatus Sericytochromatia bacterium]
MKTTAKLGLLTSLYFSQGLPFGFFSQALPVILRQREVDLAAIGLSHLLALPWALKFLWAPAMDRLTSRRRPILWLQGLTAVTALVLAMLDPSHGLAILIGAVLISNLLAATQDVATDGLAIALLTPQERGLGNGIQVAGYRLGMIVGGGLLLMVADTIGWRGLFWSMGALLLLATIPVWRLHEPPRTPPQQSPGIWQPIRDWLRQPGIAGWLGLLVAAKAGDAFASGMVRPMLVDAGLSLADIGRLIGTAGFLAGLLGALLGGWLAGRLGRARALLLSTALQTLGVLGYAAVALQPTQAAIWSACLFEHVVGGMVTAALFTAMMDTCRRGHEGSDYTLQASLVVAVTGLAAALSGYSASGLGYPGHFALATALSALGVGYVIRAAAHPMLRPSP